MQSRQAVHIIASEWRWVIIVASGLILLAFAPLLWMALTGTSDWQFMGALHNYLDGATYLSKIVQGERGIWLTFFQHTPENYPGRFYAGDLPAARSCRPDDERAADGHFPCGAGVRSAVHVHQPVSTRRGGVDEDSGAARVLYHRRAGFGAGLAVHAAPSGCQLPRYHRSRSLPVVQYFCERPFPADDCVSRAAGGLFHHGVSTRRGSGSVARPGCAHYGDPQCGARACSIRMR